MRRVKQVMLWLVCASMLLSLPVFGQESSGSQSSSRDYNSSKDDPWKDGGPGVKYVYIPPPPTPARQPDFLILQLSAEKYTQFKKNAKEFLDKLQDKLKLFAEPLKSVTACSSCQPKADPPADEDYHYVMIRHWPTSDSVYQSFEGSEAPSYK